MRFSANSYWRLTDWRQSRNFVEYDERPANGVDLRGEAWLPSYPQLGGKLMYEFYRGDEVALFGKDTRQKNPYAVTVAVNYTPIPLVTIGAGHRAGKGNNSDARIDLSMNYRLGAGIAFELCPRSGKLLHWTDWRSLRFTAIRIDCRKRKPGLNNDPNPSTPVATLPVTAFAPPPVANDYHGVQIAPVQASRWRSHPAGFSIPR